MSARIESIRDSAVARWTALGIVAFTMLAAYFFADVMSPLKTLLETEMHWDSSDYGFFTSAYGWFNVFLFMLLIGGYLLDKKGIRFTGQFSAGLMVLGALIKYWGIASPSLVGLQVFGISAPVFWAAIGYAIFAVGSEVAGITVTKVIVKWFKGKEMAMAMGVQVALARLGTGMAMIITVPFANAFHSVPAPVLLGAVLLCIGLLAFIGYSFMDKKLDAEDKGAALPDEEDAFKLSDVKVILMNKGFWLITLLCLLFYSSVLPFMKYATDLMVNKFHVDIELAGTIPGLLPFGAILLTPLFGGIYDKRGRGASLMILGAVMLFLVHVVYTIPALDNWILAVVLMIVLGIAFSLVPSAIWPSVAKIIPEKQLGTAYALIFWIQNIGLMGVPFLVGKVLDRYCKTIAADGTPSYDYTLVMAIFAGFALLSIFIAFALKREDARKHYGLEQKSHS